MKRMKIDYTQTNLLSKVPNSFAHCECNGVGCNQCSGAGKIFLPFICLHPQCLEGFEATQDLETHMLEAHGILFSTDYIN